MNVLDTSALIKIEQMEDAATVPEVIEEVKNRPTKQRIENEISAGRLRIIEAGGEAVKIVQEKAKETGDDLSDADTKLLALALEQHGRIYTDDYSLQNVASHLGVEWSAVELRGISEQRKWKKYCRACRKFAEGDECPTCGTRLVRRTDRKN